MKMTTSCKISVHWLILLTVVQVGLTQCKSGIKEETAIHAKYREYPPELICFVRHLGQLHDVDDRISETYVEIDQLAYYDNIQLIRNNFLDEHCRMMVVLKSDAYGHGLDNLAKVSEFAGADYFGITETREIIKLRSQDVKLPVMRIRLASFQELETVQKNPAVFGEVEEMVGNLQMVKFLSEIGASQNRDISVHINLNTGEMSRNSFDMTIPSTKDSISELLKLDHIAVTGIMTHFANADTEHPDSLREKISNFQKDAAWIIRKGGLNREEVLLHVAASSLAMRVPESHLDMVRLGSIIFGEKTDNESPDDLKPVMSVYSSIGHIMFYPEGSRVGYGSIHRLTRDSWLANIPIGKANGIPRKITNALIKGHKFPVVGAMSMNTTMVDITALHDRIRSGDEVVFLGRQGDEEISTEEIWDSTGVDPWTMHCSIGQMNWEDRYPKKLSE